MLWIVDGIQIECWHLLTLMKPCILLYYQMNINLININKYSGDQIPVHSIPVHSGEHSSVNSRMNLFCD